MITILFELALALLAIIFVLDLFTGFKILRSIGNRLIFKKDQIAQEIRDPVADAHAAISQIEQKKEQAVTRRKELLAKIHAIRARIAKENKNIENFEDLAKLAGKAKNADDVRSALEKKKTAQNRVENLNQELVSFQKLEDELENMIKNCDDLIQTAKDSKERLMSELENNKFRRDIASVLKDNSGEAMGAIQQLENDVLQIKAQADSAEELAGENVTLEQKYKVPTNAVSDDELSKYLS